MKLVIFGSTGDTGRQLVIQALASGHEVTAFARSPEKLALQHRNLQLVTGNVLDFSAVAKAIQGQDAVLCALGTPPMNRKMLRANGTKNIIRAMEQAGVKRFICQSGHGCGDSYDSLPLLYKHIIFPFFLRYVYADHEHQESLIMKSKLDWIIARPGSLTNGDHTGAYWHGTSATGIPITTRISRADVADFMLGQLTDNTYLHKTTSVSYARYPECKPVNS